MEIRIEDHSAEILSEINSAKNRALEMCGLTAERYAKKLCPVDTGNLRNSITHKVDGDTMMVGTNNEYAPYVEHGTGKYSDEGGRQTPWVYVDGNGNFHMTNGQKPKPYIKPAIADNMNEYRGIIKDQLGGRVT